MYLVPLGDWTRGPLKQKNVMPALNFKKQFAPKVESGEKRQTIRAIRNTPFKEGDILYLYTGMRTRSCRKLGEAKALEVQSIVIIQSIENVLIDEIALEKEEITELAQSDGFDSSYDFFGFFAETYKEEVFEGQLIKW